MGNLGGNSLGGVKWKWIIIIVFLFRPGSDGSYVVSWMEVDKSISSFYELDRDMQCKEEEEDEYV